MRLSGERASKNYFADANHSYEELEIMTFPHVKLNVGAQPCIDASGGLMISDGGSEDPAKSTSQIRLFSGVVLIKTNDGCVQARYTQATILGVINRLDDSHACHHGNSLCRNL